MSIKIENKVIIDRSIFNMSVEDTAIDTAHIPLSTFKIYFKFDGEDLNYFKVKDNSPLFLAEVECDSRGYKIVDTIMVGEKEQLMLNELIFRIIYIMQNESEKISNHRSVKVEQKKKKKKQKNKKQKNYVYINSNKYIINREVVEKIIEKNRNYNFKTDKWTVRGHWREYKSGKRVWVKEHINTHKTIADNSCSESNYRVLGGN